ncbi:MAG: hypothetical protein IJ845_02785 [Bacteroidaceae bacterium]|nr:hypothetical protein [Bacteroidaceae bacterium]
MRNSIFYLVLLGILFPFSVSAQLRYPVVGTYKGNSAQGMAIYGDFGYLMNNSGHCRVLDLRSGNIGREFELASASKNNHVNNVCFGKESLDDNNIPLLYISEYLSPYRCFVEQIKDDSTVLIQTIAVRQGNNNVVVHDWVVDTQHDFIYTIRRINREKNHVGGVRHIISKYRLPSVDEGRNIVLDDSDKIDSFDVFFANGLQGAKIRDEKLYIATGLREYGKVLGMPDADRALIIVDLISRQIERIIDLTYVTILEPEDIDFYEGKCLLYCGQNGGIYELSLEESVSSNLSPLKYTIVGDYENTTAQGMAILGNFAYITNRGGLLRKLNLQTGTVVNSFFLGSADSQNLANTVSFGKERKSDADIPVMYVSEYQNKYRCFVEQVYADSAVLVQTINATDNGKVKAVRDWVVDSLSNCIYGIERINNIKDKDGKICHSILKYRLPKLGEGSNVVLTEADLIDSFKVYFFNALQGAKVRNGMMYIITGLQELDRLSRADSERSLYIVDLNEKAIYNKIDLSYVSTNPPQDIDFKDEICLIFFGGDGGIYETKID